jgi:hypothetical protein
MVPARNKLQAGETGRGETSAINTLYLNPVSKRLLNKVTTCQFLLCKHKDQSSNPRSTKK